MKHENFIFDQKKLQKLSNLFHQKALTFDWAFTLENTLTTTDTSYKTFDFDWAPGFSFGVGYNFEYDHWDTNLSYSWFQSNANGKAEGSVTTGFLPARLSGLQPFSSGKATLHIHYNMLDWDLGREFFISQYLSLRPSLGVKGGGIKQTMQSHWEKPLIFAKENLSQRFIGLGPKGGAIGKWYFNRYFSLVTQFDAGYLWGHWKMQDKFTDNLVKTVTLTTTKRNYGSFMVNAFLGFGWENSCDKSKWALNIGYEIEDWFNQAQFFTDIAGSMNSDLILQGLNCSINCAF